MMHPSLAFTTLAFGLSVALPQDAASVVRRAAPGGIEMSPALSTILSNIKAGASPTLAKRQDIDFDLADSLPNPTILPDDSSNYNPSAAAASVIAEISASPLPQNTVEKRNLRKRDILHGTSSGYTANIPLGNASINAPLDCNGKDTYMGVKLFTSGTFDTNLCALACSAQSAYNLKHPPSTGKPQTCQFYNTYALWKNAVYQGQYCAMYNQTWAVTYATNQGQWRGTDRYTISDSYIASNATEKGDTVCPSDIAYLQANGAAFCTSYLSYVPPTTTVVPVVTSHVTSTSTAYTTATTNIAALYKRAPTPIATPSSASSWSPGRISSACSAVATGKVTVSSTSTQIVTDVATSLVTITTTVAASPTGLFAPLNIEGSPWTKTSSLAAQYTIGPQFSQDGTDQDAVAFTFTGNVSDWTTQYMFWHQDVSTFTPGQLYEIDIQMKFDTPAPSYASNCVIYLGGHNQAGAQFLTVAVDYVGYFAQYVFNGKGGLAGRACSGQQTMYTGPAGEWQTLTAYLQADTNMGDLVLQVNCPRVQRIMFSDLTVTPYTCPGAAPADKGGVTDK